MPKTYPSVSTAGQPTIAFVVFKGQVYATSDAEKSPTCGSDADRGLSRFLAISRQRSTEILRHNVRTIQILEEIGRDKAILERLHQRQV
jgi:hypothetical protein